jgi:hypothetical protein
MKLSKVQPPRRRAVMMSLMATEAAEATWTV